MELFGMKKRDRKLMTPEERAAHLHFPKRFRTVELIGPRIPASFIITKIPSKRRQFFEWEYSILSTTFRKISGKSIQDLKKSVSCSKSGSVAQEKPEIKKSVSIKNFDNVKGGSRVSSVNTLTSARSKSKKANLNGEMGKRAKMMSKGKKPKSPSHRGTSQQNLERVLSGRARISTVTFKDTNEEKKNEYLADTTKKKIRLESLTLRNLFNKSSRQS